MVVLLILAILLAIAIPTFLGVTKSANDRAAQSNLNTALLNAKAQYQQNSQSYPATLGLLAALSSAEPSLTFQAGASGDQNHISAYVTGDGNALVLAAFSKPTGNCWIVVDTPVATTVAAPFAAAVVPAGLAADTTLATVGASNVSIAFVNNTLGPTYAEIKTVSTGTEGSAQCVASQPIAFAGTSYRWSNTAFPSI
jgi:type II secretory pathway pseudopilin PulG